LHRRRDWRPRRRAGRPENPPSEFERAPGVRQILPPLVIGKLGIAVRTEL
jgi:hypothetical protein